MENVNGKYIHVINFNTLLNISQCIRFTATAWLQANAYRMILFVHIHLDGKCSSQCSDGILELSLLACLIPTYTDRQTIFVLCFLVYITAKPKHQQISSGKAVIFHMMLCHYIYLCLGHHKSYLQQLFKNCSVTRDRSDNSNVIMDLCTATMTDEPLLWEYILFYTLLSLKDHLVENLMCEKTQE